MKIYFKIKPYILPRYLKVDSCKIMVQVGKNLRCVCLFLFVFEIQYVRVKLQDEYLIFALFDYKSSSPFLLFFRIAS